MTATRLATPKTPLRLDDWVIDPSMTGVVCLIAEQTGGLPDANLPAGAEARMIQKHGVGVNCGEHFANDVFVLRDFCWCDDSLHPWDEELDQPGCPPNFEHFASGISGTWYKYLARDVQFNRAARPNEALAVLHDCLRSLAGHPGKQHLSKLPAVTTPFRRAMGWADPDPRK